MKKIILVLLMAVSFSVAAQETTVTDPDPSEVSVYNLHPQNYGTARACGNFIGSDGALGPWGVELQAAIRRAGQDCFFNGVDFSNLCPSFSSFSETRKMQFIAFLFAIMAFYESSCIPTEYAEGKNDRADGLLGLEYTFTQRQDARRDPVLCVTDRETDTQNIRFQMECSAAIFRDGYCQTGEVPGVDHNYWQKLNGERKITTTAREFPYCNESTAVPRSLRPVARPPRGSSRPTVPQ